MFGVKFLRLTNTERKITNSNERKNLSLRSFSMFLQNFSNWKPFRAVAAFMLVLVMATACQETAQVINEPIAAKKSAVQSENIDTKASTQSIAPLSEAERALIKKWRVIKTLRQ